MTFVEDFAYFYHFLAHLAEGHESLCHGAASVQCPGRKHAWGMGIHLCSNKGAGPFWGPIKGNIRTVLINLQKSSSHEPLARIH